MATVNNNNKPKFQTFVEIVFDSPENTANAEGVFTIYCSTGIPPNLKPLLESQIKFPIPGVSYKTEGHYFLTLTTKIDAQPVPVDLWRLTFDPTRVLQVISQAMEGYYIVGRSAVGLPSGRIRHYWTMAKSWYM
ncbi:PREDICTED: uncharacterized protein LOC109468700 [Branchiostoma belcheri]|uniref:Uncharacterized protein LOC109468700 n=1 Tax=Branchiostoma belcheri TaxID=7741 RepID=A0A6P4YV28_BRABE|nr:PREDICTED: uncharacterized protein LOC109468700 [Branchiostoma belcheri]XP_019622573.1 PREDICTED: uncharacterized protein LOC109468700 [Branchiostoma belcheri]